jgi:glutathione S-transferase
MTLADIQLAGTLTHAHLVDLPIAEFPRVAAWFERIQALPAWRDTALPG